MKIHMTYKEEINSWVLQYNIIELQEGPCFGIEVTQYENAEVLDRITIANISNSYPEVERLFCWISKESVFPISLLDIVEDWLREKATGIKII